MSSNKTVPTDTSVDAFLQQVEPQQKQQDAYQLLAMMTRLSGHSAKMWGSSIIGFGQYHYCYASGREGDFMRVGFAPRKNNLSVYIIPGFDQFKTLLGQLGKHKLGKSCLYVNKLSDINTTILEQLIVESL